MNLGCMPFQQTHKHVREDAERLEKEHRVMSSKNNTLGQTLVRWMGHAAHLVLVGFVLQGCTPSVNVRGQGQQVVDASVMSVMRVDELNASSLRFGPYQVKEVSRNANAISSTDEASGEAKDVGHYQGYAFQLEGQSAPVTGACTAEFRQDQAQQALECDIADRGKHWQLRLRGTSAEQLSGALAAQQVTMQIVKENKSQHAVPLAVKKADYFILQAGRVVGALHKEQSIVWIKPNLSDYERELVASATAALLLLQKMPSAR